MWKYIAIPIKAELSSLLLSNERFSTETSLIHKHKAVKLTPYIAFHANKVLVQDLISNKSLKS